MMQPVIGEDFEHNRVEILVFPSPTGYMFDISRFFFINLQYILKNPIKWWVNFLKFWTSTGSFSNSISSSITSSQSGSLDATVEDPIPEIHKDRHNMYTLNSVVSHLCGNQSARDITEVCRVKIDMWYYRISVVCDTMREHKVQRFNGVVWCGVVHSTWPSHVMWQMHAPTFNKWHKENKKKNKNKKVTLHILTHGAMQRYGLTSWVVCINDKIVI